MAKVPETFPSQGPSGASPKDKSEDDAVDKKSIFSKIKESDSVPQPAAPSGFSEWLIGKRGQGGRIGTFAMFAVGQNNWPMAGDKEAYNSVVSKWGLKEKEGFRAAWEAYENKDKVSKEE
jgi:hypothetical protein